MKFVLACNLKQKKRHNVTFHFQIYRQTEDCYDFQQQCLSLLVLCISDFNLE